jgi:hypothetical protein
MYNWQKSSFSTSNNGNCVEIAAGSGDEIVIRESDDPSVIVATSRAKMAAFIKGVKAGEFDHFV